MAHPHQPPDSGAQGPGDRQKALSCRHPRLDWFSVGMRRLEEARATGLACRGAHSGLLTRSGLRSARGRGVRSRSLWLVGRLFSGRISALWCNRAHGRRQGLAHRVVANPWDVVPVSTLACLAGFVLASLCGVCLLSGCFFCSSLVGTRLCQPSYGRLVRPGVNCAAARASVAGCYLWCGPGSSQVFDGGPVRCGGCVATGVCPARCVGSLSSWRPVVRSSRVVQWPVWAWSAAFGRCRLSLTSFGSHQVCFLVVSLVAACPRVRLLCCCQHFVGFAVVVAPQWSACPAAACAVPWWPCRVGSGCSSCVGPAWYVLTLRRRLTVGCVLRGRK